MFLEEKKQSAVKNVERQAVWAAPLEAELREMRRGEVSRVSAGAGTLEVELHWVRSQRRVAPRADRNAWAPRVPHPAQQQQQQPPLVRGCASKKRLASPTLSAATRQRASERATWGDAVELRGCQRTSRYIYD